MLAAIGAINELTSRIIKAAIEVHRVLGPGLLEAVYVACLIYELSAAGMTVECQVRVPVVYKGVVMDCFYRIDLLVDGIVNIEVKAIETVLGVHRAQLLTQMRLASKPAGLLLNFNVELLKHGITRLLNKEALESMGAHN